MYTDKETGKILTFEEAMEKVKKMTYEEKIELLNQIHEQLNIQPLKSRVI